MGLFSCFTPPEVDKNAASTSKARGSDLVASTTSNAASEELNTLKSNLIAEQKRAKDALQGLDQAQKEAQEAKDALIQSQKLVDDLKLQLRTQATAAATSKQDDLEASKAQLEKLTAENAHLLKAKNEALEKLEAATVANKELTDLEAEYRATTRQLQEQLAAAAAGSEEAAASLKQEQHASRSTAPTSRDAESATAAAAAASSKVAELEKQVSELNAQLKALHEEGEATRRELERTIVEKQQALEERGAAVSELDLSKKTTARLQGEVESLQAELTARQDMARHLGVAQVKLEEAVSHMGALEKRLEALQQENEQLRKAAATAPTPAAATAASPFAEAAGAAPGTPGSTAAAADSSTTGAVGLPAVLTAPLPAPGSSREALELRGANEQLRAAALRLEREKTSLAGQVEAAKSRAAAAESRAEQLHAQVQTLQQEVSSHTSLHEAAADQTSKLLSDYAALKERHTSMLNEMKIKEDMMELLQQQLTELADLDIDKLLASAGTGGSAASRAMGQGSKGISSPPHTAPAGARVSPLKS